MQSHEANKYLKYSFVVLPGAMALPSRCCRQNASINVRFLPSLSSKLVRVEPKAYQAFELRQDIDGMEFKNFASVRDVLDGRVKADFLVLRSQAPAGARTIVMDFEECERAVRSVLGEPWRSTESALAFRISREP